LIAQLDDTDHRERRGFTRLQNDRVPCRKRRRDLSARVNGRPVEGDDCADNPKWFQHRRRVDAAGVVLFTIAVPSLPKSSVIASSGSKSTRETDVQLTVSKTKTSQRS